MTSYPQSLVDALGAAGLSGFAGPFVIDDQVKRFKAGGDKEANCWYSLHVVEGDFIVGAFGCWKRGFTHKYSSRDKTAYSKEDWAKASKAWKDTETKRAEEEKRNHESVRAKCRTFFNTALPVTQHGYLARKNFTSLPPGSFPVYLSNDSLTEDWLALPLRDAGGTVHSAQFIAEDGAKRFYYQGRVAGCYYELSEKGLGPIILCEGYATGLSLFAATGWSVKCAMNCGNLLAVAKAMREKYPTRQIVVAADNDQFTEDNPGVKKAGEVVKAVSNSVLAVPSFGDEASAEKPTDFNDLHRLEGLFGVRIQIEKQMPVSAVVLADLQQAPENDPTELLRSRYLCEGAGLLVSAPSGIGKSSFLMQAFALWSLAMAFFGISPTRKLRCLIIQSENDESDLAMMRDGVATGLNLTQEQRKEFFNAIFVHTCTGITGPKFCTEVLAPLLDLYEPNLVGLDPMLGIIGGDVKEQKVVGDFLRLALAPQLLAHRCAVMMMHHTNKPLSGKEKPNWRNGDLAYLGAGSAEWTNWARAILSIQSSGTAGIYQLHAAKRGAKLNWKDPEGAPSYQKTIAWSRDCNVICWRDADQQDHEHLLQDAEDAKHPGGRPPIFSDSDLLALIPPGGLSTEDWRKKAAQELNVSRPSFYRIVKRLEAEDKTFKSPITSIWTKSSPARPFTQDN